MIGFASELCVGVSVEYGGDLQANSYAMMSKAAKKTIRKEPSRTNNWDFDTCTSSATRPSSGKPPAEGTFAALGLV